MLGLCLNMHGASSTVYIPKILCNDINTVVHVVLHYALICGNV